VRESRNSPNAVVPLWIDKRDSGSGQPDRPRARGARAKGPDVSAEYESALKTAAITSRLTADLVLDRFLSSCIEDADPMAAIPRAVREKIGEGLPAARFSTAQVHSELEKISGLWIAARGRVGE